MPERPGDRHAVKPINWRPSEADDKRLRDYADTAGIPLRRIIADAVRHWLDRHAPKEDGR